MLSEARKALATSDNDKRRLEQALRQSRADEERVKQAQEQARKDSQAKYKSDKLAKEMKRTTEASKMTYKSFFIGQMIFTLALAFFVAYGKRGVLLEMGNWFPSRWNNIKSFFSWMATKYMAAIQFIQGKWELHAIVNYLMITVIALGLLVGLFFIASFLVVKMSEFITEVRMECLDLTFKDIVSADIVLIMLYITLFFSDPIQSMASFNVFSVWLILSFIGVIGWYIFDIIGAVKRKS